eukprot:11156056-Lingulodinium_polyedra.AAC.1
MPSPTRQWTNRAARPCADAATAAVTVVTALRNAAAVASASKNTRGCNSRSTGNGWSASLRRIDA